MIFVHVVPLSVLTCHWCAVAVGAIVVKFVLLDLITEIEVTKFEEVPVPVKVFKVPVAVFVFLSIIWALADDVIDVLVPPAIPWLKL